MESKTMEPTTEKVLSREELQRLLNVLSGITQRTAADIANLNDRVVTLNQVMQELNTFIDSDTAGQDDGVTIDGEPDSE